MRMGYELTVTFKGDLPTPKAEPSEAEKKSQRQGSASVRQARASAKAQLKAEGMKRNAIEEEVQIAEGGVKEG